MLEQSCNPFPVQELRTPPAGCVWEKSWWSRTSENDWERETIERLKGKDNGRTGSLEERRKETIGRQVGDTEIMGKIRFFALRTPFSWGFGSPFRETPNREQNTLKERSMPSHF